MIRDATTVQTNDRFMSSLFQHLKMPFAILHQIPVSAAHLRLVLREYVEYYNNDRTHLALEKDSPHPRPVEDQGAIVAKPILGGLHHRYRRI